MDISKYIELLTSQYDFQFSMDELLQALTYFGVINQCSKNNSLESSIPSLYHEYSFSPDQVYEDVEFIGRNHKKIIEIINHQIASKYKRKTDKVYFDCTNFYFEIYRKDDFRNNRSSIEHINSPIVRMGLMLDSEQIPVGMKFFRLTKEKSRLYMKYQLQLRPDIILQDEQCKWLIKV